MTLKFSVRFVTFTKVFLNYRANWTRWRPQPFPEIRFLKSEHPLSNLPSHIA